MMKEEQDLLSSSGLIQEVDMTYIDDLCRICAKREVDMVSIFGEEGTNLRLQLKINSSLPIKVENEDILPLSVCQLCVHRVESSYELTTICQEADVTLRNLIAIKNEQPQEITVPCPEVSPVGCQYIELTTSPIEVPPVVPLETIKTVTLAPKPIGVLIGPINFNSNTPVISLPKVPIYNQVQNYNFISPALPVTIPDPTANNTVSEGTLLKQDSPTSSKTNNPFKMKLRKSLRNLISTKNVNKKDNVAVETNVSESAIVKTCEECSSNFLTTNLYYMHMLQVHKIYLCEVHPDFKGYNYEEYKEHRKHCREHLCPTCGKTFVKQCDFTRHILIHGEKSIKCQDCDKRFISKKLLNRHRVVHIKAHNYICKICERRFKHPKYLERHKQTVHTSSWTFNCNMCAFKVDTHDKIMNHCDSVHTIQEKNRVGVLNIFTKISPYQCQTCEKYFSAKPVLTKHLKTHKVRPTNPKVKPKVVKTMHVCDFCDRGFPIKNALKCHMASHLGVKEFECHMCDKSFHAYCGLRDHIAYHNDTSVFSCNLCNKSFPSKTGLNLHTKAVHLNLRPYECHHCGKKFKAVCALKCHLRTHSNEKFKCEYCEKSYKFLFDKKKHQKKRHPQLEFDDSAGFIYSIEIL